MFVYERKLDVISRFLDWDQGIGHISKARPNRLTIAIVSVGVHLQENVLSHRTSHFCQQPAGAETVGPDYDHPVFHH